MIEEKIFTENPEDDLWRELLQYSYKANVRRYLKEHSLPEDERTIDCIIGSFLQANEYYKASKNVNLQISPLLLYYGTTNLLFGMTTLINSDIPNIKNHGMKPDLSTKEDYIADTSISFSNYREGGIHQFTKAFGYKEDLTKFGKWQLKEFLSSIAEINLDYKKCYSENYGNTIMLDIFKTPTGDIERLYCSKEEEEKIISFLKRVYGFDKSYMKSLQYGHDSASNRDFLILRRKMNSKDIKNISFSGQPYLQAGNKKQGNLVTIPTLFNMYISLFIMSSLCRYHPEYWGPFVLNDETGERLLFEKLMYFSRRMIPNFILNKLYGNKTIYVTQKYTPKETIKHVSEHEVKELIKHELYEQVKRKNYYK